VSSIPLVPSPPSWVAAAIADPEPLLIDHAHCEKKAADTAIRHAGRFADHPRLAERMSRLAREELVHFEQVLAELRRRGITFRNQPSSGYAAGLFTAARGPVDIMICCALIEARSHERLALLAGAWPEPELRALYTELCIAEERHGDLYLTVAGELAREPGVVEARAAELAAHEATVLLRRGMPLRVHSGGV
jgi:tRNA 2-(methylsulfanyl)-N6-isopentenyladenosine37 hydroxylase